MNVTLHIWHAPRVSDTNAAAELVGANESVVFEASNDVHWFYNELVRDAPGLESTVVADVPHEHGKEKWFWADDPGPVDRLVTVTLTDTTPPEVLDDIFSLAAKYDLVVYDPENVRLVRPLEAMAAYAEATFWPSGAIQAGVAGLAGLAIAVVAWIVSIPILSFIAIVVGGFMFVMAVYSFIHAGRVAVRSRDGSARG